MALVLTYTPNSATAGYPVAGTLVTLAATGARGTSREFELTSTPDESALSLGHFNDLEGNPMNTFTPDTAGEYGIKIVDYRDTGFAPSRWEGDVTAQRGKKLLQSATGIVYVGEVVELPIVTLLGHGATLRLTIVNETVRIARLVNPLTEVSRLVCLDEDVLAAADDLVDLTISALGNDLVTAVGDLVTNFEAHRGDTANNVHAFVDSVNAMLRLYVSSSASIAYVIDQLNEARGRVDPHARAGSSSTRWHVADDTVNTLLVGQASNLATATVLMADLGYRVYDRHRALDGDVHEEADVLNAMATAAPLTLFIVAFLDAIALIDPVVVPGESEGAGDAAHRYGFARTVG